MRQLFNVETTGGDIGRHQHAQIAGFEISQRTGTRALTLVTVDRRAANAVFVQLLCQMVRAVFGTGEDQHLLPVALPNHLRQQFPLAFFINKMHVLSDLLRGGIAARHFDFQRVAQQFFRKRFDLIREGCGEQQVLTFRRQLSQHAADVMDKAHVQHTVRFVENEDFHAVEFHGVLVFQIE